MKKIGLGTLLILCLAATVQPQEKPPRLLFHAAQCLASKKFLPPSKAAELTFGYVLDEKSIRARNLLTLFNMRHQIARTVRFMQFS